MSDDDGEHLSERIEVRRLQAGLPLEELARELLPRPVERPWAALRGSFEAARGSFDDQRYGDAGREYEASLRELAASRWSEHPDVFDHRFEAVARLGWIGLHSGALDEARARLEEARWLLLEHRPGSAERSLVEIAIGLAGVRIDRFDPDGADQLLTGLGADLVDAALQPGAPAGERMIAIGLLGARRRIDQLRGDSPSALMRQELIVALSPTSQRARDRKRVV